MEQHWIWFDGCVGDLKNARMFQWLYSLHKKFKLLSHIWNYFETGHGKEDHDKDGAFFKTSLHREELKLSTNFPIRDARSIARWCTSLMGEGSIV